MTREEEEWRRKKLEICVYLIFATLFLFLIAGGVFLVLSLVLPESDDTAWYSAAGMALVAVPWLFWGVTCLYRAFSDRATPAPGPGPPARAPPAAGSPPGARRVRFGATTVLGDAPPQEPGAPPADGSSHNSRESEIPLVVQS
ncbi:uncharacterized protein LOC144711187 [Wolffia australiana]